MPYKALTDKDLFFNPLKTTPKVELKIWNGKVITPTEIKYGLDNLGSYRFLPKGSSLESFKTVTTNTYAATGFGVNLTGSYPLTSSINVNYFYAQTGFISEKRKVYALKNVLNSYLQLSRHYAYSSSLGNKAEQTLNLVSIPAIHYGSSINKGSVELTYYVSGTLVGKLQDIHKNGELIQTTGALGSGSVAGVVLYNEGFVVLTGSWALNNSFTGDLIYNPSPTTDNPRWVNWAAGHGVVGNTNASCSYDLNFEGVNYVNAITMLCRAEKGEFNYSNNPTFLKYQATASVPLSGTTYYKESSFNEIKNIVKYPYNNFTGSLEKQTYISKIGIYDENGNLIGIAKLAKPVKKTENRNLVFKLKVDI